MNRIAFSLLLATFIVIPAQADWVLNSEESTVSFVSTKAINIAEVHKFANLTGSVNAEGRVEVMIGLSSVDTGIEIRDDRMREMLFDTETYALAKMTANVDIGMLNELKTGDSMRATIEGELSLHGESVPMSFDVVVARTSDSQLLVMSEKPVVVNAPLFKLAEGVERLREIAGLPSISTAVPVSFLLSFDSN